MRKETVTAAEAEARRFLAAVKAWKTATSEVTYEHDGHKYYSHAPKQSGTMRRASLDLTRALAEMRKP